MKFQNNISLSKHTSFKIGGPARYFCIAKSKEDLIKAVKKAKELNLPFFILGGGSNVLALDQGYEGLVIKILNSRFIIHNSNIDADAGVNLNKLACIAAEKLLAGLEWANGIPGTVGGAVYGNAQVFDTKISNIVKSVEVLDIKTLKIRKLLKSECLFSTKNSVFKQNKNLIILSVVIKLKKGNKQEIKNRIKKHLDFRRRNQPLNFPSAGSIFVNKTGTAPSSYLIEKAGLKGTRIGGVKVSEKHAGFIINTGKAKAKDVLDLIKIIKQKVKSKFGITLKEEIQIIKT